VFQNLILRYLNSKINLLYYLIYTVKIKFDSLDKFVLDNDNNEIELSVSSIPLKGKANNEIIQKISNYFNIKSNNVKILRGVHSKTKVVEIMF
jgi:uncharacterized protein YggU (UPF0235/DUF167 family)